MRTDAEVTAADPVALVLCETGDQLGIAAYYRDYRALADALRAANLLPPAPASEAVPRLVAERDRARDIAVALEGQVAAVQAVAEEWRYKGECGWGPWQMGNGPDPEGQVLDECASAIRAVLDPDPAKEA